MPVTVHPHPRRFHYLAPLGTRYRLERTPECRAAAGFDLEERNQMTSPGDHVQLDAADPKPMRDDLPASGLEVTDRLLLAGEPPLMPRVAPIRRIAMNAAGHAQEGSAPRSSDITETPPLGANISQTELGTISASLPSTRTSERKAVDPCAAFAALLIPTPRTRSAAPRWSRCGTSWSIADPTTLDPMWPRASVWGPAGSRSSICHHAGICRWPRPTDGIRSSITARSTTIASCVRRSRRAASHSRAIAIPKLFSSCSKRMDLPCWAASTACSPSPFGIAYAARCSARATASA